MKNYIGKITIALLILSLTACEQSGDSEGLKQEIEKNKLGIASIIIKPKYTRTLDPVSTPPANPQYYFAHGDQEQLQAYGITSTNDEILLSGVSWEIIDNSGSAGATTIDTNGLLKTETLPASQTKDVTVKLNFAALTATADVVISSHPLLIDGLSIKVNGAPVSNNDTRTVVVCDTTTLTAQGVFGDGSTRDITSKIDWTAALTNTNARFNLDDLNNAIFSSHTNATYAVTPDYKGQGSATVNMLVAQTGLDNFSINTTELTLKPGETYEFLAHADIDSGNGSVNKDVTRQAKWTSANAAIFTVNNAGLVTGVVKGGPNTLTAQCGSATLTANITVATDSYLQDIKILDASSTNIFYKELAITNNVGDTVQLKLQAYMSDNTELDVTTDDGTTWEIRLLPHSGDPITVNNTDHKGLVTAIAAGTAEVVAKYKGKEVDLIVIVTSN